MCCRKSKRYGDKGKNYTKIIVQLSMTNQLPGPDQAVKIHFPPLIWSVKFFYTYLLISC